MQQRQQFCQRSPSLQRTRPHRETVASNILIIWFVLVHNRPEISRTNWPSSIPITLQLFARCVIEDKAVAATAARLW